MCAVVFGRVKEGMAVVRKIEACGSSSGRTRQPIVIAECGELPSRRQILAKLAAEKEALANMKKDPIMVRLLFLVVQASRNSAFTAIGASPCLSLLSSKYSGANR
jgi:hypothetical protein